MPVNMVARQKIASGAGRPSSGSASSATAPQAAEAISESATLCRCRPEQEEDRQRGVEDHLVGERPVDPDRVRHPGQPLDHGRVGQPVRAGQPLRTGPDAGDGQQRRAAQAHEVERVEAEDAAPPEGGEAGELPVRRGRPLQARRDDEAAAEEEDHDAQLPELDAARGEVAHRGGDLLADVLQQHQRDGDAAERIEEFQPRLARRRSRPLATQRARTSACGHQATLEAGLHRPPEPRRGVGAI